MKGQLKVSTPKEYLAKLKEPRKSDIAKLDKLIRKATSLKPYIHSGMLAYGPYRYKYASGREGEWFRVGVSSNASYISLYVTAYDAPNPYVAEQYKSRLPKAKIGKSCVTFKKLDDLDEKALVELLEKAQP
jgi:hypothetical protein